MYAFLTSYVLGPRFVGLTINSSGLSIAERVLVLHQVPVVPVG